MDMPETGGQTGPARCRLGGIAVRCLTGGEVLRHLDELARLRMTVFAEWPYLYDGSFAYEEGYLREFADEPGSVLIGAFAGGSLVGAATASPLMGQKANFRAPLEERGLNCADVFYFGESVLLPQWRGHGIGHAFFDQREAAARAARARYTAFVAVDRPHDHPSRPANYWPLNAFWRKRGYVQQEGVKARLRWKDHGESADSEKTLNFWLRDGAALDAPADASPDSHAAA